MQNEVSPLTIYAAIAQLVERFHGKEEVSGSNPDRGSKLEEMRKLSPEWAVFSLVARSADVATPPSTASRAAPHQPPPLHFSEISPRRISFLVEKGLAGGGVVALATWRLIQKVYNDFL